MTVALISHSDCGFHDTGWGHPEHVGRLRAIPRALREDPELFDALLHVEARHATEEDLATLHDPAHIVRVRDISVAGGGQLDTDTVASAGSWNAALAAVGAVLDGVDMAFDGRARRCFCAIRPPGHHALRNRSMGFCLFGNVAIGAHYARRQHSAERVLVVDWDVHHGNGTQALVEDTRDIHFVSMHQWPWYPGTGAAEDRGPHHSVWNVPMPPKRLPREYVDAFRSAVEAALVGFVPDLIMISAGFDSLAGDPLGAFTLEYEHFDELTKWLVGIADDQCGGRIVSALEGGYAPDRLGVACVRHMKALL
jgi:acetoin utilization deacetylase AcuC-like enzyme